MSSEISVPCPYDFNGKTIAVTGVATGIGKALAQLLKASGCRVIGLDIQSTNDNVDNFIQVDLSDPASITNAVSNITDPLDGLCNIAGLPPRTGLETKILQVNFFGLRDFTLRLKDRIKDGAAIVNMASRAGHGWQGAIPQIARLFAVSETNELEAFIKDEGINATRAYNLSKEAVILWTKLQTEDFLQNNIRLNTVSPGGVSTAILDDFAKAFGDKMAKNVKRAGRPAQAEEVARTAMFLLSDESAWLKGEDITIDGGMAAFAIADKFMTVNADN